MAVPVETRLGADPPPGAPVITTLTSDRVCECLRSGPLLSQTNGFPALRWLNVSSNAFTGALPSSYGSSGIFTLVSLV